MNMRLAVPAKKAEAGPWVTTLEHESLTHENYLAQFNKYQLLGYHVIPLEVSKYQSETTSFLVTVMWIDQSIVLWKSVACYCLHAIWRHTYGKPAI